MEVPPDSLQREEVSKNDLGRRSPWWGGRKEGTSDLKHSWSQFLVGFIHPVRWHPPDDGRLCSWWGGVCKARRRRGGAKGGLGNQTGHDGGGGDWNVCWWAPIQTTTWRGVVLALNLLHHQGGAQNSQKSWKLRSDQDGGSGGHLLGQRQMQVSEKATGDLLVFIYFCKIPLKLSQICESESFVTTFCVV